MNDLVYAGDKAIFLVLIMSAFPIIVATVIGLIIGLIQTVTQLQEQTLPFGLKLLGVSVSLFIMSDWYGKTLVNYAIEMINLCLS